MREELSCFLWRRRKPKSQDMLLFLEYYAFDYAIFCSNYAKKHSCLHYETHKFEGWRQWYAPTFEPGMLSPLLRFITLLLWERLSTGSEPGHFENTARLRCGGRTVQYMSSGATCCAPKKGQGLGLARLGMKPAEEPRHELFFKGYARVVKRALSGSPGCDIDSRWGARKRLCRLENRNGPSIREGKF